MLWAGALLLAFLPVGSQTSFNVEGEMVSVTKKRGSHLTITCDLNVGKNYVHWYRFEEGQAPQRLLYYDPSSSKAVLDSGLRQGKYKVYQAAETINTFVLRNVEEGDAGVHYCAVWTGLDSLTKTFGKGTKLVVTDKVFHTDVSPKPTLFLPSIAETSSQSAGTYLCLLENFFPEDIQVFWKESGSNGILRSQQGATMKTEDTYMKLSWLTVKGNSMHKEHKCIVKHEKNRGGVENEIIFPPINKVVSAINPIEASVKDEGAKFQVVNTAEPEVSLQDTNGLLSLQHTSTFAYYTYLLLLLKGTLHGALVTFCLCRRSAVCCDGKST